MIIDKVKKINEKEQKIKKNKKASDMMIGKWVKCDSCKEIIYKEDLHNNLSVCPNCGKHFRLSARRRIKQIADEGTFESFGDDILTKDPLQFKGYLKKVEAIKEKTKIDEAVQCGICKVEGEEIVLVVMDGNFLIPFSVEPGSGGRNKITYRQCRTEKTVHTRHRITYRHAGSVYHDRV